MPATFDGTILISDIPIDHQLCPAVPGSATPPQPHHVGFFNTGGGGGSELKASARASGWVG